MRHGGIAWFRQRQHRLALGVLASFCLAWLQLAALPCANAFAPDVAGQSGVALPAAPVAHHAVAMPGHASMAHCPYCPPDASPRDDGAGVHHNCSYPHSPQVDSRLTSLFAAAVPVAVFVPAWIVAAGDASHPGLIAEPAAVPARTPLAARPSRLIE